MNVLNHRHLKRGVAGLASLLALGIAQPGQATTVYSASYPDHYTHFQDFTVDGVTHRVYLLDVNLAGESYSNTSPSLGGTAVVDDLHDIICGPVGSTYSVGEIQVRVVDTGPTVDFYWRITSVAAGHTINSVNISDIGTSTLDIDYRPDGMGSVAPDRVTRDDHGYMDFHFDGATALSGSESSRFFFIRSSTDTYNAGHYTVRVQHDGSSVTCEIPNTYGP